MAGQMQMQVGLEDLRSPAAIRAAVAEFVATALFVFVGVGSIAAFLLTGGGGIIGIATAHGLAIALLVASIGPISGGHINPAVTFATVITNRISVTRGAMYVVAQLAGAVIGALLLKAFLADAVLREIPGAGGHKLATEQIPEINARAISSLGGLGVEAVLTFVLVWTVFATAINVKGNTIIAPLAIGFAILAIHLVAIPITGAGVNPARTFGPALVFNRWTDHWVYWIGPLLGGGVAGLLYYFLYLWQEERAPAGAGLGP